MISTILQLQLHTHLNKILGFLKILIQIKPVQ